MNQESKATWISAIHTFQSEQTVIKMPAIPYLLENQFELAIDLPLAEDVIAASAALPMAESICWEIGCANETPAPNQQRGASLVILAIATLLCALLVLMVTGFISDAPNCLCRTFICS
jgi:hypothetical protein